MAILYAIGAFGILALLCGSLLGFAARRFEVKEDPVAEQIDDMLPQSQCAQCGYPGCRPYAQAVAAHGEKINKCVPGGEPVMLKIAGLLNVAPQPLAPDQQPHRPAASVAWIDESNCIGCTKCIQACPVDAIIGATRAAHTVVSALCTGCELCVAPCPTDCIALLAITPSTTNWNWDLARIPIQTIPVEGIQAERHV
jgi:electron transport complex protein RnfB